MKPGILTHPPKRVRTVQNKRHCGAQRNVVISDSARLGKASFIVPGARVINAPDESLRIKTKAYQITR